MRKAISLLLGSLLALMLTLTLSACSDPDVPQVQENANPGTATPEEPVEDPDGSGAGNASPVTE